MNHRQKVKRRREYRHRRKARRRLETQSCANYCAFCKKILHATPEEAAKRVDLLKESGNVRKEYMLGHYRCPEGRGWHIGHNFMLPWLSLCIGEHK